MSLSEDLSDGLLGLEGAYPVHTRLRNLAKAIDLDCFLGSSKVEMSVVFAQGLIAIMREAADKLDPKRKRGN